MKRLLTTLLLTAGIAFGVYANDIYVTQSGDTLDLDITQDGQNNQVGNSTTASTVTGATEQHILVHLTLLVTPTTSI